MNRPDSSPSWLRKVLYRLGLRRRKQPGFTFTGDQLIRMLEVRSATLERQRQSSPFSISPIHDWLAAVHVGEGAPREAIRDRFHSALDTIAQKYPEAPAKIGTFLVAAKSEMEERGGKISLLSLTESAAALARDASGGRVTEAKSYQELITAALLLEIMSPYERLGASNAV
jgi:hypothetical protein